MRNIAMLVGGTIALLGIEAGPAAAVPASPGVIAKQSLAGEQIEQVHLRRHRHHHRHHSYRRYYGSPYKYYGYAYSPPVYAPYGYGYFGGGGHHFGGHHFGGHHGGHH